MLITPLAVNTYSFTPNYLSDDNKAYILYGVVNSLFTVVSMTYKHL